MGWNSNRDTASSAQGSDKVSGDQPFDASHDRPRRGANSRRPARRFVVLVLVAIVVLPILWFGLPGEIARWYAASADQEAEKENWDAAISQLDTGISWVPDNTFLPIRKAQIQIDAGRIAEAVDTLTEIVGRAGLTDEVRQLAVQRRAFALQRIKRHDEAIADLSSLVEARRNDFQQWANSQTRAALALALNNRAYAYALANKELDLGLKDIGEAFDVLRNEDVYVYLDTRGYLRFLKGDLDDAKNDMEVATELAERENANFQRELDDYKAHAANLRSYNLMKRQKDEEMSVIYHHRGLVYEALGEVEAAKQDLVRAQKLGYNPDQGVW